MWSCPFELLKDLGLKILRAVKTHDFSFECFSMDRVLSTVAGLPRLSWLQLQLAD